MTPDSGTESERYPIGSAEISGYDAVSAMAKSLSGRALASVREAMKHRKLGQRDLAGILNCSQSRVAKLLNGRVRLTVDDLEELCFAVSMPPTEAVRDRGLEFCADMTPTELRFLELLRRADRKTFDSLLHILRVNLKDVEARGATQRKASTMKSKRVV